MIPLKTIEDLISKHSILEKELSSGEVDKKLFAEKSKEYSDLNDVIDDARKYFSYEGEKKDLKPLIEAKKKFSFVIDNYPNTDFALDSKFKIGLINNILASKEMYLGRHYIKKEKWVASINRFKIILNDDDNTIYTEEAIHRLVEIHYKIGLEGEAKKYASLLGYNYLSSEWYGKTYNIFNKEYEVDKIKTEKKSLKEKFKKLF